MSTVDPLQNSRAADYKSHHVVFGYVHDMELELQLMEIASLIINVILGFYYNPEFITKYLDEYFKVSDDRLTITNIKEIDVCEHGIYLNQWIESTSKSITK